MNIIVYSIPAFFILIGVELLIAKMKHSKLYRLNDAIANLNCGITQQVLGIFFKFFTVGIYTWIYKHYRLVEHMPVTWYTWIILLVGVDFFYYWFHRLSHEIAVLWGTHVVHHQSEEYNLSVALRQSAIQTFGSLWFYLPLAWIGFDPLTFVAIASIQTVYQFWIHTRLIDRMPAWFEYIFNTPSHHRVHHGVDPKYIDKNHGGTFIIFDRLFGTFQAEEEEVHYGVTKPLNSWNAIYSNFDYYKDLAALLKQTRNVKDFFLALVKEPGWQPDYLGGPIKPKPVAPDRRLYDAHATGAIHVYIFMQFVLLLGVTSGFLFSLEKFDRFQQVILAGFIVLTTINMSGLFENKRWAKTSEYLRLLAFSPIGVIMMTQINWPFLIILLIFTIASLLHFTIAKKRSPEMLAI